MYGIYNLNESDDSQAWNYHEIRSHRKPRKKYPRTRRVSLLLAAVIAVGTLTPLSEGVTHPLPRAEASTGIERIEPRIAATVSRTARVASVRTTKINKVINYAMAQRGDRYRWGAAGPNAWDCSGLVSVAFKKGAGIKLPHFTGGIQKKGKRVAKKDLRRGDIIFPQRGHVGIYLGNGKMIHASTSKGKIVVADVYGFYTARRIL